MTCYAETDCSRPPYHHHRTLRITLINSAKFHAFSLLLHPFFLTTSYSSEKELPQFLYPKKVWDKNNKQNPIFKKKKKQSSKSKMTRESMNYKKTLCNKLHFVNANNHVQLVMERVNGLSITH